MKNKVHHYEKIVTTSKPNIEPAPQVSLNILKDVYGPGDDDYGRNPSPWKKNDMKAEMDKCVSCGKETKYPKNLNIDYREHYVEGAGQLCDECAEKLNKKLNKKQS